MRRMLTHHTLLILGIILVIPLVACTGRPEPVVQWSKTFDAGSAISFVQQTADGDYIVILTIFSGANDTRQRRLVKLDAGGKELWDKTFGGTEWYDYDSSIQQTKDGGYIICGNTKKRYVSGLPNSDIWLIKTDAEGNKVWGRTFGGKGIDYGYSVQQTTDNGYIVCGTTGGDIWLIKTDAEGNKLWDKTFGGEKLDDGDSALQTRDGGYIVLGNTNSYGVGYSNIWLIKTDAEGNKLWDKTFGGAGWNFEGSIQQTTDGGYVLCGITGLWSGGPHGDLWLIKTDTEGNKLWDKTFGGKGGDYGYSVQQTADGGYIVCGSTTLYLEWLNIGEQLLLIKADVNGNKLWSKTFGNIFRGYEGYSVQQTTDGGYIVRGYRGDNPLLLKISPER